MPSVFFSLPFLRGTPTWEPRFDQGQPLSLSLLGLCVGGDTHVLSHFVFVFFQLLNYDFLLSWLEYDFK